LTTREHSNGCALRRDLIDPAIEEHGGTKAFVLKPEALTLLETGSRVAPT
jgi:hypothetical protein